MTAALIGAVVRWGLAVGGTYLVTKGIVDAGTIAAASTPEVVGGVSAIGALAWSLWNKKEENVTGFEDQIPGGTVVRPESPGEEAQKIAGMLVPLISWVGQLINSKPLKLSSDAVASITRDVLRWWRD